MKRSFDLLLLGLGALLGAAGCGGDSPSPDIGGAVDGGADRGGMVAGDGGGGGTTLFTVVLENTSYSKIVGNAKDAPYINSLIDQYGLATNYQDSGHHPSLPNYLYLVSGDPQYPGILDVGPMQQPYFPAAKDNLGQQLTQAGIPWRAYMESMGTPCNLKDKTPYAPKHNPFVYFTDLQKDAAACEKVDVDYGAFAADLAAGTYRFMWITPNLDSDGHDTDLHTADTWCSQNLPAILGSAVFQAGGVLLLTWDEGSGTIGTDDHVPMIVVSPRLKMKPMKLDGAYTHASYLKFVEETFHLPLLGAAAKSNLPSLADFLL